MCISVRARMYFVDPKMVCVGCALQIFLHSTSHQHKMKKKCWFDFVVAIVLTKIGKQIIFMYFDKHLENWMNILRERKWLFFSIQLRFYVWKFRNSSEWDKQKKTLSQVNGNRKHSIEYTLHSIYRSHSKMWRHTSNHTHFTL